MIPNEVLGLGAYWHSAQRLSAEQMAERRLRRLREHLHSIGPSGQDVVPQACNHMAEPVAARGLERSQVVGDSPGVNNEKTTTIVKRGPSIQRNIDVRVAETVPDSDHQ